MCLTQTERRMLWLCQPVWLLLLGQAAAQYNVYYGYTPEELNNFIADTVWP